MVPRAEPAYIGNAHAAEDQSNTQHDSTGLNLPQAACHGGIHTILWKAQLVKIAVHSLQAT